MLDQFMQAEITGLIRQAVENWSRPCVLFKPSLRFNNGWWDVFYEGNYLGTGLSPASAMENFDINWRAGTVLSPRTEETGNG